MKIEFDKQKSKEKLSSLVQTTVDFGKKAAAETKEGVSHIIEKQKADERARKLKKLNPLFPEQFKSEDFKLPNIIIIVDDAVRRGEELCEGAIGWLSTDSGEEVLHLYDEAVGFSSITFVPAPVCNSVYCVDVFDRTRFINAEQIFSKAHDEKIAELQRVAEAIGAKRCVIELREAALNSKSKESSSSVGASAKGAGFSAKASSELSNSSSTSSQGRIVTEFRGLRFPKRPQLKWFVHEDSINQLIDMCCSGKRKVKTQTLELSGMSSATMNQSVARTVDALMGGPLGIKGQSSMSSKSKEEHQRTLLFHVEF